MLRVAGVSIVLIHDTEMAAKFDALPGESDPSQIKIIISELAAETSWMTFENLMQEVDNSKSSDRDTFKSSDMDNIED